MISLLLRGGDPSAMEETDMDTVILTQKGRTDSAVEGPRKASQRRWH